MNENITRKLNKIMSKSGSGMEAAYMKESIKNSSKKTFKVDQS